MNERLVVVKLVMVTTNAPQSRGSRLERLPVLIGGDP